MASNNRVKLTPKDVVEIRRLYLTHTGPWIAAKYGVTAQSIANIISGRTWSHVR